MTLIHQSGYLRQRLYKPRSAAFDTAIHRHSPCSLFLRLTATLKKQNPAAVKGSGVLCQTPFGVERIALSYQDK